jgi:cytidylate kinase
MNISENLGRYAEAIERAQQHWHGHHWRGEPGRSALTIALTREAGIPGTSVAREAAQRLGWTVYDHELLELIARELGLHVNLLESVDEKRQGWLHEAFRRFASAPGLNENSYVRHLIETILSLGKHGQCVIVGRGAAQILPAETTLRVRLIAPHEDRVAKVSHRLGKSPSEAARWVQQTDHVRQGFVRDHFLRDLTDIHQYDLLLNTSRWSVAECGQLIEQAVRRMEDRVAAAALVHG